jgi:antitoxin (DNA-binding transcriptional repressor) of toxin-antitoxin stability system
VDEAQARFSDLLAIAVGEEVVIMDKGEPVAKLVPNYQPTKTRRKRFSSAPQKGNSPFPMISTIPCPRRSKIKFLVTSPS